VEDTIHHFVMFMTHDLNMGIGFSTILLATIIRLAFIPFYKRSVKIFSYMKILFILILFRQKIHKLLVYFTLIL
jgi:hypothetical protein